MNVCVSFVNIPTAGKVSRHFGSGTRRSCLFSLNDDMNGECEKLNGVPKMVPFPRSIQEGTDDVDDEDEVCEVEMVYGSMELRDKYNAGLQEDRKKNMFIAIAAALTGAAAFFFNRGQVGLSGVALLHAMEKDSAPLAQAMCNGRPTVVDFYADWCQSCKVMAPTMREMGVLYKDRLNFVTLDGTKPANADLVEKFKVDGIPQVAFVTSGDTGGKVLTNLVGAIPRTVIIREMDALLAVNDKTIGGDELPYLGFELKNPYPLKDFIDSSSCSIASTESSNREIVKGTMNDRGDVNGLPLSSNGNPKSTGIKEIEGKGGEKFVSDELSDLLKSKSIVDVLQGSY